VYKLCVDKSCKWYKNNQMTCSKICSTVVSSPIGNLLIQHCTNGLHLVKQVQFTTDELFKPNKMVDVKVIETSVEDINPSLYVQWFQTYFIDPAEAMKLQLPDICTTTHQGMFRQQVWLTLAKHVKSGDVITYGKLASMLSKPGASRAVGSAMSNNPISIIVPCHRVIKSNGHIGNYAKVKELNSTFQQPTKQCPVITIQILMLP